MLDIRTASGFDRAVVSSERLGVDMEDTFHN